MSRQNHTEGTSGTAALSDRWQFLLDGCSDLVTVHELNGTYVYVSRSVRDHLGYTPQKLIGAKPDEFLHPKDLPIAVRGLAKVAQKKHATVNITVRMRHKNGSDVWMETQSRRVAHPSVQDHIICISRNVSKRKRVEEKNKLQHDQYKAMAQNSHTFMWLCDGAGKCTFFNDAWLQFTGRQLKDEVSQGWLRHVHAQDGARVRQAYRTFGSMLQPFELQFRIKDRTGVFRWLLLHAVPRFSPTATFEGYVASCVDISVLKKTYRTLRKRNDELMRLKNTVDRFSDHTIITDSVGRVLYANKAAESTTGFSFSEMRAKRAGGVALWGGLMTKAFYQDMWRAIQERQEEYVCNVLNRHKAGELYAAHLRIYPCKGASGKITHFAAFERPIPMDHIDPKTVARTDVTKKWLREHS